MTDQYFQQNINNPRRPRQIAPTGSVTLTADDSLVAVDSSGAALPFEVILPLASELPGEIITIVALTGAAITIAPQTQLANGDSPLVVPAGATLPLATNNATAIIQSDGQSAWYVLSAIA